MLLTLVCQAFQQQQPSRKQAMWAGQGCVSFWRVGRGQTHRPVGDANNETGSCSQSAHGGVNLSDGEKGASPFGGLGGGTRSTTRWETHTTGKLQPGALRLDVLGRGLKGAL